jgi:biotin carboxyl carrier protein
MPMQDSVARIEALGSGRYRIVGPDRERLAWAVSDAAETWVHLDGRVYVIPVADGPRAAGRSDSRVDEAALAAPMPATVVAVHVAPGQAVQRGDTLVRLEAMKMELAVTAPRDGRVRAVACRAGDLVQAGVPLVTLEEPADVEAGS